MTEMLSALVSTVKHADDLLHQNVKMTLQDRIRSAMRQAGVTQADVPRQLKISRAAVSMWINGQTKEIKSKYAIPLAGMLNVNAEWLVHGRGEMNAPMGVSESPEYLYLVESNVPVISWVRAGEFCEAHDPLEPGDAEDWVMRPRGAGKNAYALRVSGDSMTSPYPGQRSYPEGMIIIVDPDQQVLPGMRGIFKVPDTNEVTFKELINDTGRLYLKPLNPQYNKIEVSEAMIFCGRVVGAYMPE